MDQWKQCFVLLLPLSLCFDYKVTLEKTIRSKPDVTPICSNDRVDMVSLVVCKISTKGSRGEECRLLYQHGQNFESECGSRFTLMKDNQTVFLHLTSLTPEDTGNYTCECSHVRGTNVLHLSVTVEEDEEASTSPLKMLCYITVISLVTAFIIVTGTVLRLSLRRDHCREPPGLSLYEKPHPLDRGDPDDPYTSLDQSANDFYQTMSPAYHQHNTKRGAARNNMVTGRLQQEILGRDTGQTCEIYENI